MRVRAMQVFIYKLKFPNTYKVYIGQAINPESRYRRHLQKLRDGIHHSIKMQSDYPECGIPELELLESVDDTEADLKEVYWITTYNSYFDGYNATPGGGVTGNHIYNSNSKYLLDDYCAILAFLAYTDMSTNEIAKELEVSQSVVLNVSSQTNHLYLKELMPVEWNMMVNKHRHHPNWRQYPDVISPEGTVYKVTNARAFSREHKLDQSDFSKLLKGKVSQVRGWKVSNAANFS